MKKATASLYLPTACRSGQNVIGNAVDRDRWGTYQGKNLSQRAQFKSLKRAWARVEKATASLYLPTACSTGVPRS